MSSLYKYMTNQFAEELLSAGSIKIGTLYEYWQEEKLGSEIGDTREAMAFCTVLKNDFDRVLSDADNTSTYATFVRRMIAETPGARMSERFGAYYMPADMYTFCSSAKLSTQLMKEFGYDACVEIFDVDRFVQVVSNGLVGRATRFLGGWHCVYRSRSFTYDEAHKLPSPEVIKEPKYAHQCEVRLLWWPNYPKGKYDPDLNPYPPISGSPTFQVGSLRSSLPATM